MVEELDSKGLRYTLVAQSKNDRVHEGQRVGRRLGHHGQGRGREEVIKHVSFVLLVTMST
jgi:hypothetical protein